MFKSMKVFKPMPYIYQLEALQGFLGFSVLFSPCCTLLPYYLLHGPGVGDVVCTHSLQGGMLFICKIHHALLDVEGLYS